MDFVRDDLKKNRQRRRWRYSAVGATLGVALIVFLVMLEPAAPSVERAALYIDTVERGEMLLQVRGPGTLVPRDIRWIAAASEARVDRVLVKPGAAVTADTVLVEMSNPELAQQVFEAQAEVNAAEADYAALEVQLRSEVLNQRAVIAAANADYEGTRLEAEARADLAAQGIIPAIDFRRVELAAEQLKVRLDVERERARYLDDSLDARLRAARARMEQQRQNLALREQQLANLSLRAGVEGVLQALEVEAGQRLTPGMNIARVARPDELMAELRIAETQAKDIRLEQPVDIDTRNGIVAGRVIRIDPAVRNGTVQVDVEITGELPPGARPDLSVDGTILIERLDDVLHTGRPAYGQTGSTLRLFRLQPDSRIAVRVPVSLGKVSVNRVQILQGLKEGERVVLSDTSQWDDYDRIELN
ncbi:MAG TPA: HlyD family efflux transporter periplasmic adaptor subunit [Burkholderiales bacterium]|nr:HlyD family efflux transporter periplasmic adaptor subunit [Burkholderiales bacterium]